MSKLELLKFEMIRGENLLLKIISPPLLFLGTPGVFESRNWKW
jgi:hypothetical protein